MRRLSEIRRRKVEEYVRRVRETTQGKFFNYEIALEAGYADGSVFYRYLRGERDSDAIERVLREKPHIPKDARRERGLTWMDEQVLMGRKQYLGGGLYKNVSRPFGRRRS